ncbi:MAG: glutamate racemase [Candidatus Cloacimonetes bacterium]|nr:glutamate racemase [Candidatus Cloacimonadota bacterium]
MKKQPIGIFDSGVGGLTVFREIRNLFPYEDIVYFGDTARVPYGPKSKRTIIDYSLQNARFLLQSDVKIIIIACNTSSAYALEVLKENLHVPVIGVITPGAETALKQTESLRIGIIGTEGTIKSEAYETAIRRLNKDAFIFSKACPLFVSLVEEGWENHHVAKDIAIEYLSDFSRKNIDTLVLGCTHYPILKQVIGEVIGEKITLVDSAEAISQYLKSDLPSPQTEGVGKNWFYVSDNEDKFRQIASRILESNINELCRVKLGETWYIDAKNCN